MTQQYTPVAWQDETTSQQGTLINAERLNQMQQAHHYADGFEEVDAVPTADPSVAYHKIVYCTADNTFYRWDGTEWTADIDDETKRLLQEEIARATEAEGGLAQDIADETAARETADTAMQADISALESGKLDKKTTSPNQTQVYAVRGTTQKMITAGYGPDEIPLYNVEQTLYAKMPTLWNPTDEVVVNYGWATAQIGTEATARAEADTALGGRIDTEQARAEAAEQANAQAIANTYTKSEADTLLAGKASTSTVQTLDTRVGALETGLADTYNKSQVDTLLASKANDNAVVHTTGNETVAGSKNFIDAPMCSHDDHNFVLRNPNYTDGTIPSTVKWSTIDFQDSQFIRYGFYALGISNTTGDGETRIRTSNYNRTSNAELSIFARTNGDKYLTAPHRAYDPTHTNDVATIGTLDAYTPMVRTTGNQTVLGEKTMPNINNNRVRMWYGSGAGGWKKAYQWLGAGAFTVIIRGNTGTRRNGSAIIVNVAIGDPAHLGDGTDWNDLSKIVIGSSTAKQVALAYDPDTGMVGFYYAFPSSETTTIEMIGTTSTQETQIALATPVAEDPSTFTAHVII